MVWWFGFFFCFGILLAYFILPRIYWVLFPIGRKMTISILGLTLALRGSVLGLHTALFHSAVTKSAGFHLCPPCDRTTVAIARYGNTALRQPGLILGELLVLVSTFLLTCYPAGGVNTSPSGFGEILLSWSVRKCRPIIFYNAAFPKRLAGHEAHV